jgi:hypothetical protein
LLRTNSSTGSRRSTRPAEPLVDELRAWSVPVHRVDDVVSPEHGFVITRVVSVLHPEAARPDGHASPTDDSIQASRSPL